MCSEYAQGMEYDVILKTSQELDKLLNQLSDLDKEK